MLPRTLHSIHPSLRHVSAAGAGVVAREDVAAMNPPYPTPEQYARSEAQYRQQLEAHVPGSAPPVRQPPTMMAAMQRTDLTRDARQGILRQIAPKTGAPVKKYKLIFSSDARRDPAGTGTGDFVVDVTPDILPVNVYGFEVIGYSFPQAEWLIEPDETSLPGRHGWCPAPGARTIALLCNTIPLRAPAFRVAAAAAAPPPRRTAALVCELPLPANPIVEVVAEEEDAALGLPRRLVLVCVRRVGSVMAAVARSREVVLENLVGCPLPTLTLRAEDILDECRPELLDAQELPPAESPLGSDAVAGGCALDADDSPADRCLRTLTVTSPRVMRWFPAGFRWEAPKAASSVSRPLGGILRVRPPADSRDFAALATAQLRHLVAQRRFYEQNAGGSTPPPTLPLTSAALRWDPEAARFSLSLQWRGVGEGEVGEPPLVAVAGDDLPQRAGIPAGAPEETGMQRLRFEDMAATWVSARPASIPPALTPDAAPVSDNAPVEVFIFSALNASANAIRFNPQTENTSPFFEIPVRDADGSLQRVRVTSGEYHPWGLAAAATRAMRANPALAPLQLLVTPVFEPVGLANPDARASAVYGETNSLVGFRIESAAAVPYVFGLAFELPLDTNDLMLHPLRLGFRQLRLDGQTAYDPRSFSLGPSQIITFSAAELGLGVPSPLPAVPYYIPAFFNRRLELYLSGYDPIRGSIDIAPRPAGVPRTIRLDKTALFHHTQRLRLQTDVDELSALRLGSVSGVAEGTLAEGTPALWQPPPAAAWGPLREEAAGNAAAAAPSVTFAALADMLGLLHAPTNALEARTLAQTCAALFGRAGFDYGGGVSPAQDGDLRLALQAAGPGTAAATPTLAQLDALLRAVAAWQVPRAAAGALLVLATRLLRDVDLAALPGNNLAVSSGVWAAAAALHVGLSGAALDAYIVDPWRCLMGTLIRLGAPSGGGEPVPYDPALATPILPGAVYRAPEPILAASPEVELSAQDLFSVRAGAFDGPGPHTVSLTLQSAAYAALPVLHHHQQDQTTPNPTFRLQHLLPAAISYGPGIFPDLPECTGVANVSVDSVRRVVFFTPTANALAVEVAFLIGSPSTGAFKVTILLEDGPLVRLGKLLLVVGAGRASVGGNALVRASGTLAHPFDAAAALRSLGAPSAASASPSVLDLIDAGDPGVTALEEVEVVVAPLELPRVDFGAVASPDPEAERALSVEVAVRALKAAEALSVARVNLHPYSLDFAARTATRIRPERMGFLEEEYAIPAPTAAVQVASSEPEAEGMAALVAPAPPPPVPASVPGLFRVNSVVDIERGGPSYLLLSIQINGSVLNEVAGTGSTLINFSENSALMSISAAANAVRERQLIQATAYVQLGGDGMTLRLLDKQDDRSPVFYPSGMMVNWVRFMVMRPDGTPYNFHGKRTMVSLRFFSASDNPNFIAAAAGNAQA